MHTKTANTISSIIAAAEEYGYFVDGDNGISTDPHTAGDYYAVEIAPIAKDVMPDRNHHDVIRIYAGAGGTSVVLRSGVRGSQDTPGFRRITLRRALEITTNGSLV